jgi:hypothetical protein
LAVCSRPFSRLPVGSQYQALMPQAAGALAAGAAALLVGQVARAVFDQASAAQQLVALERARTGSEQP